MQEKHYWNSGFFMLRNIKVSPEDEEHGSSKMLTFANIVKFMDTITRA